MKFIIKHEIDGRMRVRSAAGTMSFRQADILQYYLENISVVERAHVYERTGDAVIIYRGSREEIIEKLARFAFQNVDVPESVLENSNRSVESFYKEKIIIKTLSRIFAKCFVPYSLRIFYTTIKMLKYIKQGIICLKRGRIGVPVLDAIAITASIFRGEFNTASSIMYLLSIGECMEDWTHKKAAGDLARSMSLNLDTVWIEKNGREIKVPASSVMTGDIAVVRMGDVIPFDGTVENGEAMVNQASLTGEGMPVKKTKGGYVYAGTAIEEGELHISVREVAGSTRFEKIITMIEESEKLKSAVESKAEHLADNLVPYTLFGTVIVWLLTRNITKTLSVLMVDFSCALKLAMPVTVLSAMRECSNYGITVKGGKYLEAVAEADTIVFDKTGTLTKAQPVFKQIIPLCDRNPDDLLRIAACLEEHFPHSMAKAVTQAAKMRGLEHEEMHSKVDYIVAHGIASNIGAKRVVIGSAHFVLDDEKCVVQDSYRHVMDDLPLDCSHLYLAIDGVLAAVICISDPLRQEAQDVIDGLKHAGFDNIVMMTGDSRRTADSIALQVGIDKYYAEVLPEDKAKFIQSQRDNGRTVVMVGDGINDSPALSAANAGIAISEGAAIAREIADITVAADDLRELVRLKYLSTAMMKRINRNYRAIMGINGGLILLGILGAIQPAMSALLHNMSTLVIGLESMRNLLPAENTKA